MTPELNYYQKKMVAKIDEILNTLDKSDEDDFAIHEKLTAEKQSIINLEIVKKSELIRNLELPLRSAYLNIETDENLRDHRQKTYERFAGIVYQLRFEL